LSTMIFWPLVVWNIMMLPLSAWGGGVVEMLSPEASVVLAVAGV